MLKLLSQAERELPHLLESAGGWTSLRVDYHPPFVDRLWRPWGEGHRLSLHRIHPCRPEEALFHPHPWPSAMRILAGSYEMGVGHGPGDRPPPIAARVIARGDLRYEMTDPDAWHYVCPIDGVAWTIMLSGRPWARPSPRSDQPLSPLPPAEMEEMLARYRELVSAG